MAGRASRPARRPATGGTAGKAGRGSCARRAGGLAHQGKGGAGRGPSANGDGGTPPSARLAAARRMLRRLAMVGPSYEEMLRMEEEDRRANTEWILGGTVGIVHEFTEFGARRDGGLPRATAPGKGNGAPHVPGALTARRRRLAAARRMLRRLAMVGPSYEEMLRMEEEDRRANTEWILGGTVGIVHEFTEFGARRDPEELARSPWGR
ncbi:MAG: hypothetical protein OXU37_08700, partial [Thaumarchaeota archaeon]|nr:hypothetical protein [Nitrososphaerota archaeon]